MITPPAWNAYQGLLASVAASAEPAGFLERAAGVLEARQGFEGAAAHLRRIVAGGEPAEVRGAIGFLKRRDVAAAMMSHFGDTAAVPWWFEAKYPLRSGRGMVPMERGALAVGDERALEWLLKVRDAAELGFQPDGFSSCPYLLWVPNGETQAFDLNVRGGLQRSEGRGWLVVNAPERLPVRALFPYRGGSRHPGVPRMALTTFQHQFWDATPEGMEKRFGTDMVLSLPDRAIIHQHHFVHPQVLLLPHFGRTLWPKPGVRIVFLQTDRTWAAQLTEGGPVDRTSEVPEAVLDYFRRLNGFEPAAPLREVIEERAGPVSVPVPESAAITQPAAAPTSLGDDPTIPLSSEQLEKLRAEIRLPYDDTSPGIPTLKAEDPVTRPARGLLELLGRIFTRRPKDGG